MTELQLCVCDSCPIDHLLLFRCAYRAYAALCPLLGAIIQQQHSNCTRTALTLHSFLLLISNSHTDTQNKMHSCRDRNKKPNSTQFFTALFAQLQTQTMQVQATVRLRLSDSLSDGLTDTCLNVPVERQDSSN